MLTTSLPRPACILCPGLHFTHIWAGNVLKYCIAHVRHAREVHRLSDARRQGSQVHEGNAQVVDEVVRVGVRLPAHGRRLHVDELHARK